MACLYNIIQGGPFAAFASEYRSCGGTCARAREIWANRTRLQLARAKFRPFWPKSFPTVIFCTYVRTHACSTYARRHSNSIIDRILLLTSRLRLLHSSRIPKSLTNLIISVAFGHPVKTIENRQSSCLAPKPLTNFMSPDPLSISIVFITAAKRRPAQMA